MNERTRTLTREEIEKLLSVAKLAITKTWMDVDARKFNSDLDILCDLALSAPSQAVMEGYVMVPEEPTANMLAAGRAADLRIGGDIVTNHADCYKAMLRARPPL